MCSSSFSGLAIKISCGSFVEAFSRSQGIDLQIDMIDYKWVTGRPTAQLAFITRPLTPETGVRFPVGLPILKYLA